MNQESENPYESPIATRVIDPSQRQWNDGVDAILATRRFLQRRVIVNKPLEVNIEYHGRGLRDRILVDGVTVVSIIPIVWLHDHFDFSIPYCKGRLPASVQIKFSPFLKIQRFQIYIDKLLVYDEINGSAD